jgi:hypothetical protein
MLKTAHRSPLHGNQSTPVLIDTNGIMWFEPSRKDQAGKASVQLVGQAQPIGIDESCQDLLNDQDLKSAILLKRFDLGSRPDFSGDLYVIPGHVKMVVPVASQHITLHLTDGSTLTVADAGGLKPAPGCSIGK